MHHLFSGDFHFAYPGVLWLMALLPLLAWWREGWGRGAAVRYSSLENFRGLGRRVRGGWWRGWIRLEYLVFALIVLALARPQNRTVHAQNPQSGVDIMLVLDATPTMLARDFTIGGEPASRVEAVVHLAGKFIEMREHDRIGMIMFAARPYLLSPLTLDRAWLLRNLERVEVREYTAIGTAIASAANRLRDSDAKSRVMVLLTDGDNNHGSISPQDAATAAGVLGIKIYAIGIGSEEAQRIPGWSGAVAILNEPLLHEVAKVTNGRYFRAKDSRTLERVFAEIDRLEKSDFRGLEFMEMRELFQWFAVPAWMLGVVSLIARHTWKRRLP